MQPLPSQGRCCSGVRIPGNENKRRQYFGMLLANLKLDPLCFFKAEDLKKETARAAAPRPGGTMLSMTYSESLRSVSSRCHSEWALHPVRQTDMLELQRLREVRAAAQARNMESFLRMHGLSLDGCTAQRTGMKYRLQIDSCIFYAAQEQAPVRASQPKGSLPTQSL
ncbi:uncharacterized protein LOC128928314 [Callithrix jacchus]